MTPYEQEAHDKDPFYVAPHEIDAVIEDVSFTSGQLSTACRIKCRNGLEITRVAASANPDVAKTIALDSAREDVRLGLRYEKASNTQRFAEAERTVGVLMAMGLHGGD